LYATVIDHTPVCRSKIEKNPWSAAEARFDEAATRLNLNDGLCKVLRTSVKEIAVDIPVQPDDGRLKAYTGDPVQHSIARGPGQGSIRFGPDVTLDELRVLAPGRRRNARCSTPVHSPRLFPYPATNKVGATPATLCVRLKERGERQSRQTVSQATRSCRATNVT
jgi:hypothetical protein